MSSYAACWSGGRKVLRFSSKRRCARKSNTGVLRGGVGAYELAQELQSIKIPDSVQAVLASRIDRLAPEQRELLQTAAVIGSDFAIALLENVADLAPDKLRALLADLQAAEFVYQVLNTASRQFRFKHALTHEVTYGSLLSRRRQELHGRVVRALDPNTMTIWLKSFKALRATH